jgi:hypothetical protein
VTEVHALVKDIMTGDVATVRSDASYREMTTLLRARRVSGLPVENTASLTFAFEEAALRQASLIAIHSWHLLESDISRAGPAFPGPAGYAAETETAKRLEQLLDDWRAKYPTFRSARTSSTATRAGRWPACRPAPTWRCSAGRSAHHGPGSVMHAVLGHAHGPIVTVPC